jgi:hypothetical protein
MQLPRGTFREIRKNVMITNLLEELEKQKFSGISAILSPSLNGTLVYHEGKCILVTFQGRTGDAGWDEIQKAAGEEVSASLSSLDEQQIQLAIEFNKACRVIRGGRPAQPAVRQRPALAPHRQHPRPPHAQRPVVILTPQKPPPKPAPTRQQVPAPPVTAPPSLHNRPSRPPSLSRVAAPASRHEERKREEIREVPREDHETSSFESDIDTLNSMNLDVVTDKIRTECKTMIKHLHLDHLMER